LDKPYHTGDYPVKGGATDMQHQIEREIGEQWGLHGSINIYC